MPEEYQKIKLIIEKIFVLLLLTGLLFGSAGCTRMVIYPSDETATAFASQAVAQVSSSTAPPQPTEESYPTTTEAAPTQKPTQTATQTIEVTQQKSPSESPIQITSTVKPPILYYTLSGDVIEAISFRFGVEVEDITSPSLEEIPKGVLLEPETLLFIPDVLEDVGPNGFVIPDSEISYSPSCVNFDIPGFVDQAGGYITEYREWRTDGWYDGAEVVHRVAFENSANPRLLLAILEYQSGWVYDQPENIAEVDYPIGWKNFEDKDLYKQLTWAVQQLFIGYYRWRAGTLNELTFPDGSTMRLAPDLNAGTVGIQYLFSKLYNQQEWAGILYSDDDFPKLFEDMFGNAWLRAQAVEPLYPPNLEQPELELPFEPGVTWNLTGGPHAVWGKEGVYAALDFAPPLSESGCVLSHEWVTASAPGLVIRSHNGFVMVDLDGDGYEQTGWAMLYMHIYHDDRIEVGTWVETGDKIGHPSCEGGVATGTHVHIGRKYNGEWIPADGFLPFVLSGWTAHNGDEPYLGTMTKGDMVVNAHVYGSYDTTIAREIDEEAQESEND